MGKALFLLICSVLSVVMSPAILTAADSVDVTGVSDAKVVETVVEPEPEPVTTLAVTPVVAKAPTAGYIPAARVNYTVTNYVGSVSEYLATYANLSYSAIYKYGKMIYGHNSYNLLGSLSARSVGEVITITEGGVTREYRVAAVAIYEKTADGNLNGDPRLMTQIATSAMGHDQVLFTCAGTSYGNGDASHRLAVYVDAV